jgi:hypothetical protein
MAVACSLALAPAGSALNRRVTRSRSSPQEVALPSWTSPPTRSRRRHACPLGATRWAGSRRMLFGRCPWPGTRRQIAAVHRLQPARTDSSVRRCRLRDRRIGPGVRAFRGSRSPGRDFAQRTFRTKLVRWWSAAVMAFGLPWKLRAVCRLDADDCRTMFLLPEAPRNRVLVTQSCWRVTRRANNPGSLTSWSYGPS